MLLGSVQCDWVERALNASTMYNERFHSLGQKVIWLCCGCRSYENRLGANRRNSYDNSDWRTSGAERGSGRS